MTADQQYFAGEWLLQEFPLDNAYSTVYAGTLDSTWSGGVTFLASRKVLDHIAAALREEQSNDYWIEVEPSGAAYLYSEGGADGYPERFSIQRVDTDPDRYLIGFGWTWNVVDPDDIDTNTEVVA
jgi:hypothetical protein